MVIKILLSACTCSLGQQCNELVPTIMGSEIKNCTSGVTGFGPQGDTCIITYSIIIFQVNELWSCQESAQWMRVSGILKSTNTDLTMLLKLMYM